MRFENERALKLLDKHGCKVDYEQRRVRFPPGLGGGMPADVPQQLPAEGARVPENDLFVGGDTQYFAPMPGMRTIDIDTWEPKTPTIEDNHEAIKVLASLEHVHLLPSYTPYCELEGVAPAMLLPTQHLEPDEVPAQAGADRPGVGQPHLGPPDGPGGGCRRVRGDGVGAAATWYGDALDCA